MKLPLATHLILLSGMVIAHAAAPEGYILEWADEFDYTGAPDPEFWTHETGGGGWGNGEEQIYTDSLENSRVENGTLVIEVHQEPGNRLPGYSSARIISREKVQWKYGRMEVRAKLPTTTGTWPAIWMLAADQLHGTQAWPDNGEIDIMEQVGYELDPLFKSAVGNPEVPNIHGSIHTSFRNGLTSSAISEATYVPDSDSAFHTYAVTWTEDRIEWEVDGLVYHAWDKPTFRVPPDDISYYWPFDQRFFMILNIAVGGQWGAHFNTAAYPGDSPYARGIDDNSESWPQRMEVDYVRVYRRDQPAEATTIPATVLATDLDHSNGILITRADGEEFTHTLSNIDPMDEAEFAIEAPAAGVYTVSASVATLSNNRNLSIEILDTGSVISNVAVPNTGDLTNWQTIEIGDVQLNQGSNTLKMSTTTGAFLLAAFEVSEASGTIWKGLEIDALGNGDAGSWLGPINVNAAPWIFSYSLDRYIYMPVALEETFSVENQWIYFPK